MGWPLAIAAARIFHYVLKRLAKIASNRAKVVKAIHLACVLLSLNRFHIGEISKSKALRFARSYLPLKQLSLPLFRTLPVYATPLHLGESEEEAPTL
jgi:hypothetical protein